jgi:hypothetical protein
MDCGVSYIDLRGEGKLMASSRPDGRGVAERLIMGIPENRAGGTGRCYVVRTRCRARGIIGNSPDDLLGTPSLPAALGRSLSGACLSSGAGWPLRSRCSSGFTHEPGG